MLTPEQAAVVYKPFLDSGIISKVEYDEAVATRRHTPDSEIQKAIDSITDPRMAPLLDRVAFLNDQFWSDAAELHFGQTSRSNMQRLFNHPLLWWPASYMVHATKWLGGILFERMGGRDTGALGAWTLAQVHQQHAENWIADPEYRQFFMDHPTLMFMAEMLIPLTPYGMGVSLSPITRGMLGVGAEIVTGVENPYTRNITDWGPLQTFGSTIPRFIARGGQGRRPGGYLRAGDGCAREHLAAQVHGPPVHLAAIAGGAGRRAGQGVRPGRSGPSCCHGRSRGGGVA